MSVRSFTALPNGVPVVRRDGGRRTDAVLVRLVSVEGGAVALADHTELMQHLRQLALTASPADLAELLFSALEGDSTTGLAVLPS